MRRHAALAVSLLLLAARPAAAQEVVVETIEEIVDGAPLQDGGAQGWAVRLPEGAARYGPFRLIDERQAALVDVTDTGAPEDFAALLREHPGVATLVMAECPGTEDDRANLRLGRMIHARGIATHVPEGGFVGSGAVELFVAGVRRTADPGAQFAVHSWEDDRGREAKDYAADAPENRAYIDYYRSVGMTLAESTAFYAMTNSVPFANPRWLTRAEMARWVPLDQQPVSAIAALDSPRGLP